MYGNAFLSTWVFTYFFTWYFTCMANLMLSLAFHFGFHVIFHKVFHILIIFTSIFTGRATYPVTDVSHLFTWYFTPNPVKYQVKTRSPFHRYFTWFFHMVFHISVKWGVKNHVKTLWTPFENLSKIHMVFTCTSHAFHGVAPSSVLRQGACT